MTRLPILLRSLVGSMIGLGSVFGITGKAEGAEVGSGLIPSKAWRSGFPVAVRDVIDVDGDGRDELILIGTDGRVQSWGWSRADGFTPISGETLVLSNPKRSLVGFADSLQRGNGLQLVVASPSGVTAYPFARGGGVLSDGELLARRARFRLRTGIPKAAPIVQDVDGDGRPDLVLPTRESCELWRAESSEERKARSATAKTEEGSAKEQPRKIRYRRTARVAVDLSSTRSTGDGSLSSGFAHSFRIPNLESEDVDGDGRPDLLVTEDDLRSFHLQRDDGSIPVEPDVSVDLRVFQDTTPRGEVRPGEVAAFDDARRFQSRDLDGDSIPDYVIAHRRKIWVFHGTHEGPQFTRPSFMLRSVEDFTALALVELDEDERPDLLLIKFKVPTVATLVLGMLRRWSVELSAIGFENLEGTKFGSSPRWKRTLSIELPPILEIMRDPQKVLSLFEEMRNRFREEISGDFDGDGRGDLALISEGGEGVEVWKGREVDGGLGEEKEIGVGRFLFDEDRSAWTLEDLFGWLGGLAEERVMSMTQGRSADQSLSFGRGDQDELDAVVSGDLDGDGAAELIAIFQRGGRETDLVFQVVAFDSGSSRKSR